MAPPRENDIGPRRPKGNRSQTEQSGVDLRQQRRRRPSRQAIAAVVSALTVLSLHGRGANAADLGKQILSGSPLLTPRGGGLFGAAASKAASVDVPNSTPRRDDASALRELRATVKSQSKQIQSQSNQIASLEKRLSSDRSSGDAQKSSAPSHGAHGPHGGVEAELHDYLDRRPLDLALERVWWLGLFLASLSLTAVIMSGFEHTLSRQIELAYFVPLLIGHGGNTGGQTVGTVLAAMSSGVVGPSDAARVVGKEACSGLSVGVVLGLLVSTVSRFVMGVSPHVSTVVLFTIPLVSTIAATLASFLPFMCIALGLDPTVIAAPAMTSFVDVTGLLSYFLIAQAVFKMFGLEL